MTEFMDKSAEKHRARHEVVVGANDPPGSVATLIEYEPSIDVVVSTARIGQEVIGWCVDNGMIDKVLCEIIVCRSARDKTNIRDVLVGLSGGNKCIDKVWRPRHTIGAILIGQEVLYLNLIARAGCPRPTVSKDTIDDRIARQNVLDFPGHHVPPKMPPLAGPCSIVIGIDQN